MQLRTMLRRINLRIGTLDDVSGRAINPVVPNRVIIDELNCTLEEYANHTKGITDVFSFPIFANNPFYANTPFIQAPPLALRSESYYFIMCISQGVIYPMDMRSPRDIYKNFRYNPVSGITSWIMPWGAGKQQFLSMFPTKNLSSVNTLVTTTIFPVDTQISVASTAGFIANHGRLTIENEKILYEYKDNLNFYGCQRGVESTTPARHDVGFTVYENSMILFYSRLPTPIIVKDDNFIDKSVLDMELEFPEEHGEGIILKAAYPIVLKIDAERAKVYGEEGNALFDKYKADIAKGYYRGRQGTGTSDIYPPSEGGLPYGSNLIY